jgi:nucleoid-associated protein YgaU
MKQGLLPVIIAGVVGLIIGIAAGTMITKPDREKTRTAIAEAQANAERAQLAAQQQIQNADSEIANLRNELSRVTASLQQNKDVTAAKTAAAEQGPSSAVETGPKQFKTYTVREGDSLWKIAASQLGNGSRFEEIAKLNADVLKGREDNLNVGMQLKIPAK